MNFKIKAYLQNIFSALPHGERINYLFQRFVTRGLPLSEDTFIKKVNTTALKHAQNINEFNALATNTKRYYEFGAGWDLLTPLTFALLEFEVTCIDIRRLVIPSLINETLLRFSKLADKLNFSYKNIPGNTGQTDILKKLSKDFNLHYKAPLDAARTGFDPDYFDCMSSTDVLEHIPREHLLPILQECYRILKPGGILSLIIDYRDHYTYFDKNVTDYDFLQYSESQWEKYNSSLHYQNRLRHSDYLSIIQQSGFKIVKENAAKPDEWALEKIKGIPLDSSFNEYDIYDLGITGSELVLIK